MSLKTRRIDFNGKFLSYGPTAVHRVAEELLKQLDPLLVGAGGGMTCRLVAPHDILRPLPLDHIPTSSRSVLPRQTWEQFELPLRAGRSTLVNLCNLAPLASRHGITMIHDAQVFISPDSYSKKFRTWYQFALPTIGRNAAAIITVSDYSKSQLARFGVAPAEKIHVIHNGVDHLPEDPAPATYTGTLGIEGRPFVVALANTQAHKNVGVLIRAFDDPSMTGVRLVLVGKHTAADFEAIGVRPGPNVIFAGRVSDAELLRLYMDATCFAFPSLTEGFGLPPLEAMRAGCPSVVAPNGALPEVCGDACVYAAADDPAQWTASILELIENADMRARLVAAGRQHAAGFTWRSAAKKLFTIIDGVSRGEPPKA